jgi:hypothetical protein
MKLVLDSNRYDDLLKGDDTVAEIVETADEIHLPFIVI